jgi:hypothetical protein
VQLTYLIVFAETNTLNRYPTLSSHRHVYVVTSMIYVKMHNVQYALINHLHHVNLPNAGLREISYYREWF